ncbi:GspH/FimT family pseudopilin [Variovorax sp. NFACC27]|jgi:type IV fimbrial biogenesis protein FimT|uniref:GspH/FimT family pseudopilin n=1 Tax=unclassified Variovorax TaxID=663243 RepID=UPI000B82E8FC
MPAAPRFRPAATAALRGVSLIELMVGIAIIAIAVAMGAPSFTEWIYNSQIRSTAESVQNGLQFARAEAVRRNTPVRMQFTTSLDSSCAISTTGTSWVVSLASAGTPASKCNDDATVLQSGQPVSGRASATITSDHAGTFGFNGLGRIVKTTSPDTDILDGAIDIKSSKGTCAAESGGTLRCLRVLVSAGGQIRMCDPKRGSGDPMACTP